MIYGIGGAGTHYKRFFSKRQNYVVTNISKSAELYVDATSMPFEADSVSAMASHFALEHIYDYMLVISEVKRCLKPGGRFCFLFHLCTITMEPLLIIFALPTLL